MASSLPPNVTAELGQLLSSLTSPDNNIRSVAEKSLNDDWISGEKEKQEVLLVGLAEQAVLADNNTVSCETKETV
jgi:hypothetical protein